MSEVTVVTARRGRRQKGQPRDEYVQQEKALFLEQLCHYYVRNGMPASVRELQARCDLSSTSITANRLRWLEQDGLIKRAGDRGTSRGYIPTSAGLAAAGVVPPLGRGVAQLTTPEERFFCARCGTQVLISDNFCGRCGRSLSGQLKRLMGGTAWENSLQSEQRYSGESEVLSPTLDTDPERSRHEPESPLEQHSTRRSWPRLTQMAPFLTRSERGD